MYRLKENARNNIAETTKEHKKSDENVLTPRNILIRILCELNKLYGFERLLLQPEVTTEREFTVLVASDLPNFCAIYKLFNDYYKCHNFHLQQIPYRTRRQWYVWTLGPCTKYD